VNCPKCGDKVDMNAGHVCPTGNDRLKERITYLQARIAELENDVEKWKDGHKLMFDTAMKKDHEFGLTMQYANELVESKRRIAELEAEVVQYKTELDRVLEAYQKAIIRLNEWNHNLAKDFVTLLVIDLQGKEEQ
jgi:uncharacterized protein involved in exopolysaccharide biosynthesis